MLKNLVGWVKLCEVWPESRVKHNIYEIVQPAKIILLIELNKD
ncbi:MAG: hypothetical protein ACJAQ2_000113 [Vicingaceae bacterium]|jgi:hypothetical protein